MNNEYIRKVKEYDDFSYVFKNAIENEFSENWTDDKLKDEFELFSKKGIIMGYYHENHCEGIAMLIPRNKIKFSLFKSYRKDMFLSDVIVLPNFLGNGVFNALVECSKKIAKELGFCNLCMRINNNVSGRRERNGSIPDDVDILIEIEKIRNEAFF